MEHNTLHEYFKLYEDSHGIYIEKKNNGLAKRIIHIAYTYNKDMEELKYGAVIFRKNNINDKYNKIGHKKTAFNRLEKNPVILKNIKFNNDMNIFKQNIRKFLYKYGVHGLNNLNKI